MPPGYDLPNWWTRTGSSSNILLGNTEETLESCNQTENGATIVVVASGGELAGMCELSDRAYLISCPSGQPLGLLSVIFFKAIVSTYGNRNSSG